MRQPREVAAGQLELAQHGDELALHQPAVARRVLGLDEREQLVVLMGQGVEEPAQREQAPALGVAVGVLAGALGGWVDEALMRFTELFQTIPGFVLAVVLVAILGLFGALANRKVGGAFALVLIALNALQWMGAGQVSNVNYLLRDPFMLMFMGPFAFGMLFTLYGDKIPMDSRLAWGGLIFGLLSYASGGWNIVGQYGFLYFLMYLAIRLPLQNWEKHGDLSYGIYIYAWPIMAFAAYFHLQDRGWIAYHLTVVVTVHILAYLSWHLIEKPAMSQKNYLPGWMDKLIEHFRPAYEAVARRIVTPALSSTRIATVMEAEEAAARTEEESK